MTPSAVLDDSLDAGCDWRNLSTMPTLSPSPTKAVSRRGRAVAKRRVSRKGPSFGAAVRKYAGIVRSGMGDLSTREGFGD